MNQHCQLIPGKERERETEREREKVFKRVKNIRLRILSEQKNRKSFHPSIS